MGASQSTNNQSENDLQDTPSNVQASPSNVQDSTSNLQVSTTNLQASTTNLKETPSKPNIPKLKKSTKNRLGSRTDLSAKQIEDHWESFNKEYPSGAMKKEDFKAIYQVLFREYDVTELTDIIFNMLDKDGDGQINFKDFIQAINVIDKGSFKDRCKYSFRLFDKNGDKSISYREMLGVTMLIKDITLKYLSKEQRMMETSPKFHTDDLFDRMDKDKDERLSFNEFKEGILQDKKILKTLHPSHPSLIVNEISEETSGISSGLTHGHSIIITQYEEDE